MLVIQSGYKSDLEKNQQIFVLYINNGSITYNCSVDARIISSAKTSRQLADALIPMINSLSNALFPEPEGEVKMEEEKKVEPDLDSLVSELEEKIATPEEENVEGITL